MGVSINTRGGPGRLFSFGAAKRCGKRTGTKEYLHNVPLHLLKDKAAICKEMVLPIN
jgi:hypothetical protein